MTLDLFFKENPRLALAFSGGADSAYLLYEAVRHGADALPVYVKSVFQPAFELEDAEKLCCGLNIPLTVISVGILSVPEIAENGEGRCYYCKKRLFEAICGEAERRGYPLVCDGSNASDDEGDRPGMAALRELGVVSPLRICGITKAALRQKSREAGLFTHDKPAYACLATRIKSGEAIDASILGAVEKSEGFLRELGFSDFRVRVDGGRARLEVLSGQMPLVIERRGRILERLGEFFGSVTLDLRGRDNG